MRCIYGNRAARSSSTPHVGHTALPSVSTVNRSTSTRIDSSSCAAAVLRGAQSDAAIEELLQADSPLPFEEGVLELLAALDCHGIAIFIEAPISGHLAHRLATEAGIKKSHVLSPTIAAQVTPDAEGVAEPRQTPIQHLRQKFPYESISIVCTAAELSNAPQGADLTIAFLGAKPIEDSGLRPEAGWLVRRYSDLKDNLKQHQVAFIGSGAWATAAAKLAAENVSKPGAGALFNPIIKMWVFEEEVEGRKLSEIVNERHQNVKYLPGVQLPENIVACPDLEEVARDASVLVVCTPHQFVYGICKRLRGAVDASTIAISLTKGMRVRPEGPQLISEMIRRTLNIDCSVLMGANIAELSLWCKEVAKGQLSEGTIGYSQLDHGSVFKRLFESEYYLCALVNDVVGAEMAGTLKNVVALGAGFVDGLGGGANPKATVIRCGLLEMRKLAQRLYPTVQDSTFLESCGAADLVASCYGGRNRRVAEAFVRSSLSGENKPFDVLEAELLRGQKLQGVLTSNEVQQVLEMRGWQPDFPLFCVINAIVNGRLPPSDIYRFRGAAEELLARTKP